MLKQLEEKVARIGDYTFYITPFPAFKASGISGELTPVLAPIVAAIAPVLDEVVKNKALMNMVADVTGEENEDKAQGNQEDIDASSIWDIDITSALSKIGSLRISGESIEKVARLLLLGGHIVADNVPRDDGSVGRAVLTEDLVNEIFCGGLEGMYILCWRVISINFGNFFWRRNTPSGGENIVRIPESKHRIL